MRDKTLGDALIPVFTASMDRAEKGGEKSAAEVILAQLNMRAAS